MKADRETSAAPDDAPDATDTLLARVRLATEGIEPPADFPARVLAAVSRPRPPIAWWVQLGPAGRRVVPFAAIAAAAAMALAWSADARLDESAASAIDVAQGLP